MATTGQTINDRLNAVRYALVGQGLARTVCKATTEEVLGPKKKHIEYLLACTNEPNVSVPQLANLLIERSAHTNWAVVFKSLITMHHLMSYGNERFTQYLATSNYSFELADFMDRTTPQGYNMSTFVRKYAKYINEKAISYRTLAIDLCKIRSGSENALRTMNMDNLSKTLPIVQSQFDSLLDFSAESKDLNNGIIMSAFRLLYKDLVKLYVAYQEAIINLLERYFKLSRKKTREALEMYKKYLARMDKVTGFLRVVEAVGLDKSEMPDLTKSPASILKLLEQHLAQLEAKKRGTTPANEDDEPTTIGDENKENDEPDGNVTSEEATTSKVVYAAATETHSSQSKMATTSVGDSASGSAPAHPATTTQPLPLAASSEKQAPPQKPARPSPKASPKVSPTSSGSAMPVPPKQSSPAAATPPPPTAPPSAPAEKRAGPPERPAKPPSRPPPPTAAASTPSSSSPKNETPAGSSSQTTATDHGHQAQAKSVAHSLPPPHPPPPHPPPPHPHPPAAATATASATTATSQQPPDPTPPAAPIAPAPHEPEPTPLEPGPSNQADEQATSTITTITINTASATNGDGADSTATSSSEGGSAAPTSAASCSATMSANSEATISNEAANNIVAVEPSDEAQDLETNHVNNGTSNNNNNVEQAALEEEMPPPPPPIEDDDPEVGAAAAAAAAGEMEAHQVVDPVPGQAAEIDPVVNGENGNNAE